MPVRHGRSRLEDWEVSIIKAMIGCDRFQHDQDILAYFTRPGRSVNPARINEIRHAVASQEIPRAAQKYVHQPVATEDELSQFLADFPNADTNTGLHVVDDELLIKAREAMLFSVQAFNNPTTYFKTEMFIVAAMIAWTYLLHAFFKRENVDFIYRDKKSGEPLNTPQGQEKFFDLAQCIKIDQCPLSIGEKRNLEFLLGLRHEIEHRSTSRIDDAISAKLQACCLNFNAAIKRIFGDRKGLDRELSLSLQFARLSADQRQATLVHRDLPPAIAAFNASFDQGLSNDELNDPAYAYRVAIVPVLIKNPRKADEVFEIVDRDSAEAEAINIVLRDRERPKHLPSQVVQRMRERGFSRFNMHHHTQLWKRLDAKKEGKGFGTSVAGTWYWYDNWIDEVLKHCEGQGDTYR